MRILQTKRNGEWKDLPNGEHKNKEGRNLQLAMLQHPSSPQRHQDYRTLTVTAHGPTAVQYHRPPRDAVLEQRKAFREEKKKRAEIEQFIESQPQVQFTRRLTKSAYNS
jgi:hypothetical protein